jgi:hypothetical protein
MARPDALMKSRREAASGIRLLVRSDPAGDPAGLRFLSMARLLPPASPRSGRSRRSGGCGPSRGRWAAAPQHPYRDRPQRPRVSEPRPRPLRRPIRASAPCGGSLPLDETGRVWDASSPREPTAIAKGCAGPTRWTLEGSAPLRRRSCHRRGDRPVFTRGLRGIIVFRYSRTCAVLGPIRHYRAAEDDMHHESVRISETRIVMAVAQEEAGWQ